MIGQKISHYQIEEKLGEGGMGVVYRARDLNLNRMVAIKLISSRVADEDRRRRFQLEAESASSLNHPHILTVYEAGSLEGDQYLVTEFIDGFTLREWSRREKPSARQIVDLAIGIADALACAHQAAILHRDVKPENILVSKKGYAKLVDFGLAKLIEREPDAGLGPTVTVGTRHGAVLGTVAYMSPEQAAGKRVDARSDIFSFGVVLYELLTGQRPFARKSEVDSLHAILHDTPKAISELQPNTPYDLLVIVEKALEKDPDDRYQSMREMVVDLKRLQRLKKTESTFSEIATVAQPRKLWAFGVVPAVMLLGLFVTWWYLDRSDFFWNNPLANAQFTRFTDFEGTELDANISADGKFVVFLADRAGPFDAWVSQIGSGAFLNLSKGQLSGLLNTAVRSVGFSGDSSHVWLWSGGNDPSGRVMGGTSIVPTMGGNSRPFVNTAVSVAWSPDQSQIVYHQSGDGDQMFVADPDGNNPRQIFTEKPAFHNHYPAWSPDGRFVYFVRGFPPEEMDIWRIASTGGQPERITHHNSRVAYPAMISPRELLYTATAEDGSGPWLFSIDVERRISHRVSLGVEQYLSIAASADGRKLVATVANPSGSLWSVPISDHVAKESEVERFLLPTPRAVVPRFGPDYLLYLSSKGTGDGVWKYKAGNLTELWKGDAGPVIGSPAISPDGTKICFSFRKQGRAGLYLMNADGTDVHRLAPSLAVRGSLSWSPDGKWIAVPADQGNGSSLLKVPVGVGQAVRLVEGPANNPVWSPDGRSIVYSAGLFSGSYPIKAVTPEGAQYPLPDNLFALKGGDRYRFLPNGKGLILLLGESRRQSFWLLEIASGNMRQLTDLQAGYSTTGFDVSPDGKQILFDRVRENSDIVLISMP